jgi:ADP-heptose:LPS heptosyltransferase
MADMPQANPVPDKPPLHLRGGYLAIATPEDPVEACLAAPAIRALRNARPHATIALVTPAELGPLWEREGHFNHLITYSSRGAVKEIVEGLQSTGQSYESSVTWEPGPAAKAFAKMRIQQRFGYPLNKLAPYLNEPIEFIQPFGPPRHRVHYYMTLLEQLEVETMIPANFQTAPLPSRPVNHRIAIAPGSEFGPAYRWPLEHFLTVANLILDTNLEVVVLGRGPSAPEARALSDKLGEKARFLGDSKELSPILNALASSTILLSNDGHLPHFAAHLGIPAAVLFGPGNPEVRRPLGRMHRILNAHVECSPCGKAKCPLDHRCLLELSPKDISRQVADLIKHQS